MKGRTTGRTPLYARYLVRLTRPFPNFDVSFMRPLRRKAVRLLHLKQEEAAAQTVSLTGMFDGLLMFAAPDVYASQDALENVFPRLRDHARVVLFGAKTSATRLGGILNPLLRMALSRLSLPTTPGPDESWRMVAERVEGLEVDEYFSGSMFLASGSFVRERKS